MVNFIEAIYRMLQRHSGMLKEFAAHEANSRIVKLSIQLNRLRLDNEQRTLLESYYGDTLKALQALDDGMFSMIYYTSNMLPDAGVTLKQVSEITQQYSDVFSAHNVLKTMDFSDLLSWEIDQIPKDHIAFTALEVYKNYAIQELFLAQISSMLNFLDENKNGEKLSTQQLQEITPTEAFKELLHTSVKEALQPLYDKQDQVDRPYLDVDEAAKYLGMPKSTLYGLTSKREIKFLKPGKRLQFRKVDLDEWITKEANNSLNHTNVVKREKRKG